MADTMDWVQIWHNHPKPIGAIGFIGDRAVAVASFYRDADTDRDGKVSVAEKLKFMLPLAPIGQAVVQVLLEANRNEEIVLRDPSFREEVRRAFTAFGNNLILKGIYQVYFARGVSMAGEGFASRITESEIMQFAIRKGFEAEVKSAFEAALSLKEPFSR